MTGGASGGDRKEEGERQDIAVHTFDLRMVVEVADGGENCFQRCNWEVVHGKTRLFAMRGSPCVVTSRGVAKF